jgi:hypothetical protein
MMTRVTLFRLLPLLLFLLFCTSADAVEMRQNFTLTGNNGETGTGFFTWDDTVILNGNILPLGNVMSGSITVTGGATPGGTQTYLLGDWTVALLNATPDFAVDLNFSANNGPTNLAIFNIYETDASWGSRLTFTPGATVLANPPATPQAIPLLDLPGLIIISILVAITGLWHIRRRTNSY